MERRAAVQGWLAGLTHLRVCALAVLATVLVGLVDYASGQEISVSLFYLVPVTLAAWYAGRTPGVVIAVLSCLAWYVADTADGSHYSHAAIAVWNALIRLGFFLPCALLVTAFRSVLAKERLLARTDTLTALYTRRVFDDRLEHDLALAQRQGTPLTLVYVDIDDFKQINDRWGHAEGDRVLRLVGGVLGRLSRHVDTAVRLGGDEFALILPATAADEAQRVVVRLLEELRAAFAAIGRESGCSIGVVTVLDASTTPADAVAAADALMYEVKRRGKAGVASRVIGEVAPAPTFG